MHRRRGPQLLGTFFHRICDLVRGIYTLEMSEYSSSGICYLDFFVYKGSEISKGHVTWRPFFKPTSQHLPLASDSGHAPTVHSSWPKAEMGRISKRSSCEVAFKHARNHLCNRWSCHHGHLAKLRKIRPEHCRVSIIHFPLSFAFVIRTFMIIMSQLQHQRN